MKAYQRILAVAWLCGVVCWLRAAPIHEAAARGETASLRAHLDGNPALIEARDGMGLTPLLVAAKCGQAEAVKLLLEKGAEADARAQNGFTPLAFAAFSGRLELTTLFLTKGAAVEGKHNFNVTPLMWAAQNGHAQVVQLLLEKGAAVNARSTDGLTPLMRAAGSGRREVALLLLERGAEIDSLDTDGQTALFHATASGQKEIVKILRAHGARPGPIEGRQLGSGPSRSSSNYPTAILAEEGGTRLPVVGAAGSKPQVMVGGKLTTLKSTAALTFARAKSFATGRVEIGNPIKENSAVQYTEGAGGRGLGGPVDLGTSFSAEITSSRSYDDCFCVFVVFGPSGLSGGSQRAVLFRNLGRLEAGKRREVMVDLDGDKAPRFPGFFVMAFSKGKEIESNHSRRAAAFFRQEELSAHRKRVAKYLAEANGTDCAPLNYLTPPPNIPETVAVDTLPETVEACCTIAADGTVEKVELPTTLPPAVAAEILQAVSAWLFLPQLQEGRPQKATIRIPITLRTSPGAK